MRKLPITILFFMICALFLSTSIAAEKNSKKPIQNIKRGGDIEQCKAKGVKDRILLVTSAYCPHCKKVKPIIEKIIVDKGLEANYENIEVSSKEGGERMEYYGLSVQFVPTLIANCKAYVSGKKPDEYEKIIDGGM